MLIQKAELNDDGEIIFDELGKITTDDVELNVLDKTYTHVQITPSTIWEVAHNLDKNPSVQVIDSAGTVHFGRINYVDANNLIIYFKYAFGGKVYCN